MPNKIKIQADRDDDIPADVDFTGGVRGKYAVRFPKGSRTVVLDSDVAEVFPTGEAANEALRDLAGIIKRSSKAVKPKKHLTVQSTKNTKTPKQRSPVETGK